jgi:RNA recognition motif-containing protein
LTGIFGSYGKVLEVKAWKNIRMRGQAFVVFDRVEDAQKALKIHGFPLFGQPLVILTIECPVILLGSYKCKDEIGNNCQARWRRERVQGET